MESSPAPEIQGPNTRKATRRYGVSCLVCRRKKVRCCGEKPTCRNCAKAGLTCRYKTNDAVPNGFYSALVKSQARVQELEDTLRRLTLSGHDERERLISQLATGPSPQNSTASSEPLGEGSTTNDGSRDDSLQRPELDQAEVSIDEHGEVRRIPMRMVEPFQARGMCGELTDPILVTILWCNISLSSAAASARLTNRFRVSRIIPRTHRRGVS